MLIILLFISCSKDGDATLQFGDEYQGGIIFYILQEGDKDYIHGEVHGLIASFKDLSTAAGEFVVPWGCCQDPFGAVTSECIDVPDAVNEEIGAGLGNTMAILASCEELNIAARLCADYSIEYEGEVYDDWYLPSYGEIIKMNRSKEYLLDHSLNYWTSSQEYRTNGSNEFAIAVFGWVDQCSHPYDPTDGEGCWHVGTFGGEPKYFESRVRAVRSF